MFFLRSMTINEFGARLLRARVDRGWSQVELAKAAGIAPAQISRYESGKSVPRPHVAGKLADALSVDGAWLAYGEGPAAESFAPMVEGRIERNPDGSGQFIVRMDGATSARLEARARSLGLSMDAALQHVLLEGLAAEMANHPETFSRSDIAAIAKEVKELIEREESQKSEAAAAPPLPAEPKRRLNTTPRVQRKP